MIEAQGSGASAVGQQAQGVEDDQQCGDPYGLRREAFAADLAKAAPNMKNRIDIIVPDQSWLNDPRDVATAVIGLGDVPGVSAQVTQWNLLGHTHANLNQPSSLAAVYTADLT